MMRSAFLTGVGMLGLILLSACSTYSYKHDVKRFSDGVDQAAAAFNALNDRVLPKYTNQQLNMLASKGTPLGVSPACTGEVTFTVTGEGRLVADTRCLARWSAWGASNSTT
jgi:hypothetical protein